MGPADLWDAMQHWLENLATTLPGRPRAILLVSAHWQETTFRVTSSARPPLIYDYYGFPEHTYALRYDAPGAPQLATDVCDLLTGGGLPCEADPDRGFDHGAFIPLKLAFPEADIPLVQLSLQRNLDPATHIAAGRALQALRDDNVLIIGSGMSFHNMNAHQYAESAEYSQAFDHWLTATCSLTGDTRDRALADWEQAPYGRFSHPTEEHLLPLMLNVGSAPDEPGVKTLADNLGGNAVSAFQFG